MELISGGGFWSSRQQRCSLLLALLFLFLLFRLITSLSSITDSGHEDISSVSGLNRKLLSKHAVEPQNCGKSDIVINQGAIGPLPNGIPSYTVEIMNQCVSGCNISTLHLSCGWFTSATIVNPSLFKRLSYNDCLVNDGRPLPCGAALSFQYASTFSYPLSVASLAC